MESLIAEEQFELLHKAILLPEKSLDPSSNTFTFLKFRMIAVGNYVVGEKISQPSWILLIPYEEKPLLPLASPFESNIKIYSTVRKVLGKWTMAHSRNTCYKRAQHMQAEMCPGLSSILCFAYFACLTSDVLPHAFSRLFGSNFFMHLQNATNKDMTKKVPFAFLKMFNFYPTVETVLQERRKEKKSQIIFCFSSYLERIS